MSRKSPAFVVRQPHFLFLGFALLAAIVFISSLFRSATVNAQQKEMQNPSAILLNENSDGVTAPQPSQIGYEERFDGVTAPALPANWTTAITGTGSTLFATTTNTPDTPPNAVFTNDPGTVSTAELVSPVLRVGGSSPKVIFRHRYNLEDSFDGGVLEIKINNGSFQIL